ncbi:uncharacterized protein TRIVIDRAFT_226991 [Trichoderma virens Gv29-8]|uniref:Uncharacterized protein n=1 Tax=Hypocrea virens (strain Gv29-8 / FGSC 10586) TaxID=413071 RepID=G9N837_HYPVG|nr:uncharacterized protein TRIVIDRAFT_226991 [Trichoderma virens Gv29-8]EHK17148.1 hypothetical protein TRIVIDRAFT_226991 [Trichoderma virens Gv29-8]UKZ55564.1 hypothetical protein TrVGV298_009388 [Trichoderma virens]
MEPISIFTTLPDEILIMICGNMCRHCTHPSKMSGSSWKYCESTLSSLSQTCRRLRDIAQPVLHHTVTPWNMIPFVRTIIARPDLASQVRQLNTNEVNESEPFQRDIKICQAEARRLNIRDRNELARTLLDNRITYYHLLLELALALLPNVTKLSLMMPFGTDYQSEDFFKLPVAMKFVSSLVLLPQEPVDLGHLRSFLAMLPRLERLEIEACQCITQPLPLAELRSLIIERSGMGAASLQMIVRSCPKLEHFGYNDWEGHYPPWYSGDEEDACSWGSVQRILRLRKTTLKHLNIAFGRADDFDYDMSDPAVYLGSFREFARLETLWVLTTSFGIDGDRNPSFPEDVQDLVDMLPESITCLAFCGDHKNWHGIKTLALAVQQGYFPNLKHVAVEQVETEFEESRKELATLGVSCTSLYQRYIQTHAYFGSYLRGQS